MPVLYTHQMEAIKRLKNGSILVGGLGSGKSRTSIGYFYKENGGIFTVCKDGDKVIGYNPKGEYKEKPRDLVIITTAKKRDSMEWEEELELYFMSLTPELNQAGNRVMVDSWNNVQKYVNLKNTFFIFDEQRVGGTGKWAKTFIKIAFKNPWILLSATPGDTWSDYAPVFIANGFYKNFTEFRKRHCVYSQFTKFPKIDHYVECGVLEQHRQDILVYMTFDRPTIAHHEYIKVRHNADLYNYILKNRWNVYEERPCKEIAELCSVLRKSVNSDQSRIVELMKLYHKHKKVIVFYNYDYELEAIRKVCAETKSIFAEWNGHKHEEIPKSETWLYLVQYSAGAEGWNCIETDCIIFYSQTYSYKNLVQAAGRIDRMNTPFIDLYYYHFLSDAKMDVAIYKCLKTKKNFNEKGFCESGGIKL